MLPAARMAWKGDANPQWFGHPGSTVIYPLAIAYRAREVLFHGAPLFGEAPSLAERFRDDPTSFYEIGRLWVILLSVATIPLLFLRGPACLRRPHRDRRPRSAGRWFRWR